MKSYFCRAGNKISLLKEIYKVIPDNLNIFVDVFVGSGVVAFNLPNFEKMNNIYINDIDKEVIKGFELLKNHIPTDIYEKYIPILRKVNKKYDDENLKILNEIWDEIKKKEDNHTKKLILHMINYCGGYSGYKVKNKVYFIPITKLQKSTMEKFKNKMKKISILNDDYKNIIEKFKNNEEVFLYLDPPYENSNQYNNNTIDYEEMNKLLKECKCKFLLSINDSEYIRNILKDFYIKQIDVCNHSGNIKNIENRKRLKRKELFITNYDFHKKDKINIFEESCNCNL